MADDTLDGIVRSSLVGDRTCRQKMRHSDKQILEEACMVWRGLSAPSMHESLLQFVISKTIPMSFKLNKINI